MQFIFAPWLETIECYTAANWLVTGILRNSGSRERFTVRIEFWGF